MQHKSTGNPREAGRGRHASIPLGDSKQAAQQDAAARNPTPVDSPPLPPRQHLTSGEPRKHKRIATELGIESPNGSPYRPSRSNPNVHYLSGDVLARPLDLPKRERIGLYLAIAIAVVISGVFLYFFLDATANAPARELEEMEESLARDVSLDLPDMVSLLGLDDAAIDAKLKETGATYFERKPAGTAESYEIIKLPQDVTLVQAGELYALGVSKLTAPQAAMLLNGSWDLNIERKSGINMSLHYADFKSGSMDNAITNALVAENLAQNGEPDRGEDDGFGNAYATGSLAAADKNYTWTVSACPLKQIYSVAGLPDDAVYVGIRIKSA